MRDPAPRRERIKPHVALFGRADDLEPIILPGFLDDNRRQRDESLSVSGHHVDQRPVIKLPEHTRLQSRLPEPVIRERIQIDEARVQLEKRRDEAPSLPSYLRARCCAISQL